MLIFEELSYFPWLNMSNIYKLHKLYSFQVHKDPDKLSGIFFNLFIEDVDKIF